MKVVFALTAMAMTSNVAAQSVIEYPVVPKNSQLVAVEAEEVFIPNGFDDNDEAVAVIDGYLPDTCYRLTHNEMVVNSDTGNIQIVQMARRFDSICLPVRVPYWSEVSLGILPAGTFDISADGAPSETLEVVEATNAGPDDYLYAPVDEARVEADFENQRYQVILQGRFTNTCMAWDEVALIHSGKTFEVLPIVKMEEWEDCREIEVPFVRTIDLPSDMEPRRYLLHVRSLNGKSINHMFTVVEPE